MRISYEFISMIPDKRKYILKLRKIAEPELTDYAMYFINSFFSKNEFPKSSRSEISFRGYDSWYVLPAQKPCSKEFGNTLTQIRKTAEQDSISNYVVLI